MSWPLLLVADNDDTILQYDAFIFFPEIICSGDFWRDFDGGSEVYFPCNLIAGLIWREPNVCGVPYARSLSKLPFETPKGTWTWLLTMLADIEWDRITVKSLYNRRKIAAIDAVKGLCKQSSTKSQKTF